MSDSPKILNCTPVYVTTKDFDRLFESHKDISGMEQGTCLGERWFRANKLLVMEHKEEE